MLSTAANKRRTAAGGGHQRHAWTERAAVERVHSNGASARKRAVRLTFHLSDRLPVFRIAGIHRRRLAEVFGRLVHPAAVICHRTHKKMPFRITIHDRAEDHLRAGEIARHDRRANVPVGAARTAGGCAAGLRIGLILRPTARAFLRDRVVCLVDLLHLFRAGSCSRRSAVRIFRV